MPDLPDHADTAPHNLVNGPVNVKRTANLDSNELSKRDNSPNAVHHDDLMTLTTKDNLAAVKTGHHPLDDDEECEDP